MIGSSGCFIAFCFCIYSRFYAAIIAVDLASFVSMLPISPLFYKYGKVNDDDDNNDEENDDVDDDDTVCL